MTVKTRHLLVTCGALLASCGAADAGPKTVANADALWAAVKAAAPGDTILVASGVYPIVRLDRFVKAAPGVTIRAAPGAKPVLGGLEMEDSKGLTFIGFEIAMTDPKLQYGVTVYGGDRLRFDKVVVHQAGGSRGSSGGVGVFVRLSNDVAVSNSEFYNLSVGASFMDDTSVSMRGSHFHDLETDGIDVSGTTDPVIDGNTFVDFYPTAGDHPDAIQFWATKTNPVGKNAVVTNNVIRRGNGGPMPMQGIFAENQANMKITGNALVCTLYNGISVSNVAGAIIEDNFVQGCRDIGTRIIARDGSSDVTVRNNQITEKVVDLHQATGADNVRFTQKSNAMISPAKIGDTSAMETWISARTRGSH